MFVDQVMIHAKAGSGGSGCTSVHREKFKPLGDRKSTRLNSSHT